METVEPKLAKAKTDNALPKRAILLKDNDEPRLETPITDIANMDPKRAKPTTDIEEETRAKDRSDSDAPTLAKATTDMLEPRRQKLRREIDAPKNAKSNTDTDEPSRLLWKSDTALPRLPILRMLNADPCEA